MKKVEAIKSCALVALGWLAAHQWFMYQHTAEAPRRQGLASSRVFQPSDAVVERTLPTPHIGELSLNSNAYRVPHVGARPSWHRLLACSVHAVTDCFAVPGAFEEFPSFDDLDPPKLEGPGTHRSIESSRRLEQISHFMADVLSPRKVKAEPMAASSQLSCSKREPPLLSSVAAYDAELRSLADDAKRVGVSAH